MTTAAPTSRQTIESMPLWRLLCMLDDAERNGDASAATMLTRLVRERLRAMREEPPKREAIHA